jgi:excisionase family DNA binding protein
MREVAIALGVSESTVKAMIRDGRLRVVRCGRRVLIPASEIAGFLGGTS